MARYQFRLATLLRIRESVRDDRRGRLAEALRAAEVLGRQLAALDDELHALSGSGRAAVGALDVDRLLDTERFRLLLKAQQAGLRQQAQALENEIERRREALVQADRDVRVLERLRENQVQNFRAEEERRAIAALDEVASQRWLRQE